MNTDKKKYEGYNSAILKKLMFTKVEYAGLISRALCLWKSTSDAQTLKSNLNRTLGEPNKILGDPKSHIWEHNTSHNAENLWWTGLAKHKTLSGKKLIQQLRERFSEDVIVLQMQLRKVVVQLETPLYIRWTSLASPKTIYANKRYLEKPKTKKLPENVILSQIQMKRVVLHFRTPLNITITISLSP